MDEHLAAELVGQVREDLEYGGDEVGLSPSVDDGVLTIDITFDE